MSTITNNINHIVEIFGAVVIGAFATIAMLLFAFIGIIPGNNISRVRKIGLIGIIKSLIRIIREPIKEVTNPKNIFLKILCKTIYFFTICFILYISYLRSIAKFNALFSFRIVFITIINAFLTFVVVYISFSILITVTKSILLFIMDYIDSIRKSLGKLASSSFFIPMMVIFTFYFCFTFDNKVLFYVDLVILTFSIFFIYKGLFLIINKPEYLSAKNHKYNRYSKYVGMIVWLVLLVFNLYCEVLVVSFLDKNAFTIEGKQVSSILDLFYYTVYSFIAIGFGEIMPGDFLGKIITIFLFISGVYYLVVFIGAILTARVSDKEELYGFVNRKVCLIVSNLNLLLINMEKESKIDIPRNEVSENVIHKVLHKINPNSKSPLSIGYQEYAKWIHYLMISKEQCLENIRSIYTLIAILEPNFIKILLKIEDSLYFRYLEKINNQAIRNDNLSFLTNEFAVYIEIINELEQYRKDNLEEYKVEKKRVV